MLKYPPSMIAATAVMIAYTRKNMTWSPTMASLSRYTRADLEPCRQDMLRIEEKIQNMAAAAAAAAAAAGGAQDAEEM
jgi:hypothetical protein